MSTLLLMIGCVVLAFCLTHHCISAQFTVRRPNSYRTAPDVVDTGDHTYPPDYYVDETDAPFDPTASTVSGATTRPRIRRTRIPFNRTRTTRRTSSGKEYDQGYGGLENRYQVAGQTITFQVCFRNFDGEGITLGRIIEADPIDPSQTTALQIPPNEGNIGIDVQLERAAYLTTILRPNLYTDRQVILQPRALAFQVSVRLMGNRGRQSTFQGVGVELPIDDPRYESNAPITLRWPIPWGDLASYQDDKQRICFEVALAVTNRQAPFRYMG